MLPIPENLSSYRVIIDQIIQTNIIFSSANCLDWKDPAKKEPGVSSIVYIDESRDSLNSVFHRLYTYLVHFLKYIC